MGVHVARGIAGAVLLLVAISLAVASTTAWLLLGIGTILLWRGCLSCWTLGLMATRARSTTTPP